MSCRRKKVRSVLDDYVVNLVNDDPLADVVRPIAAYAAACSTLI
jgi:hypothetical protein